MSATLVAGVMSLAACQNQNDIAMKLGAAPETAVKLRVLETRRYDTLDQTVVLSAATQ